MAPRNALLLAAASKLAAVFHDYRVIDGLAPLSAEDVLEWADQLEETSTTKAGFIEELSSIYSKTYYSMDRVTANLVTLASQREFTGADPKAFWVSADVLDIQVKGSSQGDLRELLAIEVMRMYNTELGTHDGDDRHSIYIDDAIFTGNCAVRDLQRWVAESGEPHKLSIIGLDVASGGEWSLKKRLPPAVRVKPTVWSFTQTENKSNSGSGADVLRLREYPKDDASKTFLQDQLDGGPPALLRGKSENTSKLFTSENARTLVEEVFWRAGLKCLETCTQLSANVRPLGYCSANGQNKLGFGSLFVSYRNCPNNAPVALWAGRPWSPLLRRKTN